MCTACWITKATDTHSEYVILIAFPWEQWLFKPILSVTLPVLLLGIFCSDFLRLTHNLLRLWSYDPKAYFVLLTSELVLNFWFLLQGNEISKSKSRLESSVDSSLIQTIRSRVPGNTHCADSDASSMYLQSDHWVTVFMLAAFCCKLPTLHIPPYSSK